MATMDEHSVTSCRSGQEMEDIEEGMDSRPSTTTFNDVRVNNFNDTSDSSSPFSRQRQCSSVPLNPPMQIGQHVSRHSTLLWGAEPIGRSRSYSCQSLTPSGDTHEGSDASPRCGAEPAPPPGKIVEKLGTIKGVFLPCTQNILGVILFLRLPWITAQAGVIQATAVVLLCVLSTSLTSLSLSALATNGQVQAGGPYYVVSRNLGHEVGGAIGVIFYLGTTIAASMYILGAIEALQDGFEMDKAPFQTQLLALALCFMLAVIVAVGVKYVNMSAMVFLAIVIISIFCLMLGCVLVAADVFNGALDTVEDVLNGTKPVIAGDNWGTSWEEDDSTGITPSFLWCIGLFYPSVTGIMAGSNRSGVLQDAKKSIPTGTIWAIIVTSTIYLSVIWLYGMSLSNKLLKEEFLVVTLVAFPHRVVVNLGIIMSCVGAGLQCMTGAPRLLSAIALDGTMPILSPFGAPGSQEPTKAVLLTWIIASLPCLAGNLNFITPIITMFFLMMYATVNFSCFLLTLLRAPGWRPTFRYFSWHTALFGFLLCIILMVLISIIWAFVCYFLTFLLLFYIRKQQVEKDWGDGIAGIRFQLARDQLLSLTQRTTIYHPKNWRPQLLVLCKLDDNGNPTSPELITFAAMLKKGKGLLMALGLVKGDISVEQRSKGEIFAEIMRMHMKENGLEGFPKVILYKDDMQEALQSAVQATGCGALRPNTIVMGWPRWASETPVDKKRCNDVIDFIKTMNSSDKAVIMLKNGAAMLQYMSRRALLTNTIDVWWIVHDGGLLLLLPHLLQLHRAWRGCRLRIFSVINEYTNESETIEAFSVRVSEFLDQVRIKAEVIPVNLTTSCVDIDGMMPSSMCIPYFLGLKAVIKNGSNQQFASIVNAVKRTIMRHFWLIFATF